MIKLFISFFLLGLYFGAGPCMASCGPLLVSYSAGTAKDVLKSITTYFLFCAGRLAVYLALGIAVFFFGHLMTNYMLGGISRYMYIGGGIFIALIGVFISLGKNLNHSACQWAQEVFLKKDAKTVIIMGLVIGALPCAPLISVVSYIGLVAKSWVDSLLFSLCFGLGTVVSPLFLLAVFTGLLPRLKKWRFISSSKLFGAGGLERVFNFICGIVVVILGVRLFLRGL